MLRTPEHRVELLKAGVSGREIERLYAKYNGFRVVNIPFHTQEAGFNNEDSVDYGTGYGLITNLSSYFSGMDKKRKLAFIVNFCMTMLINTLFVPFSSILFAFVIGLIVIPPLMVLVPILAEGLRVVSFEFRKLTVSEKDSVVILPEGSIVPYFV